MKELKNNRNDNSYIFSSNATNSRDVLFLVSWNFCQRLFFESQNFFNNCFVIIH